MSDPSQHAVQDDGDESPTSAQQRGQAPAEAVSFLPAANETSHWRANLRILLPLLVIWFIVSFGAGILFVEPLNQLSLPFSKTPMGFWFAQQGAIYCFLAIIYVYVRLMNLLDAQLGMVEEDDR